MKKTFRFSIAILVCISGIALADTFGTGANQFTIDFVSISGDSGDLGSWSAGSDYTFSGVNHGDYRMGIYEITNDQWNKFKAAYGMVYGSPTNAYDQGANPTEENFPNNNVSWYEAAQFVNYLNISTGHQVAYKFTGTQGTSNYMFTVWDVSDVGYNAANPYRNSNAFYFLPTEDEWVKAAYWNGTTLQTYATKPGDSLHQGDGISGTGWNCDRFAIYQPWAVGSGSEELNGTYDMMGNVWEWVETPYFYGDYLPSSWRGGRGGSYADDFVSQGDTYCSTMRNSWDPHLGPPYIEGTDVGFRIASIPEPATMLLLGLGGIMLRKRGREKR